MSPSSSSVGSVTLLLDQLRAGDRTAARPLWERYFLRLVGLARQKLGSAPRRIADEEDVALSAFDSFFRRAEAGHYPDLHDRDDLWRLLVRITASKAVDTARRERAQKRGNHLLVEAAASPDAEGLDQVAGREPSPEFASLVAEECARLLTCLGANELRAVALAKLAGHTNEEIARQRDCAPMTVKRKLRRIRSLWEQEVRP